MSEMTRRDWVVAMAALMAGSGGARGETAAGTLGEARGIKLSALPAVANANGSVRRAVMDGATGSGEGLNVHETTAPVGKGKAVPHVIKHTELIYVEEGRLEYFHDGVTEVVEAGGLIYVPWGASHGISNAGPGVARYLVMAFGGDTKKG